MPQNKHDQAGPGASLWPSVGDDSSGLRDKRTVGPASDAPLPKLGPFELLAPLGSTAYGRAFRARREDGGREVALHLLSLGDSRDDLSALPLLVAKVAQLSHPNVVAVEHQGCEDDGDSPYLITDSLEGVSLARALDDETVFTLDRTLNVALQIGRALRAAHALGIVHGALDPHAVRLSRGEAGELARVVGFECARFSPRSPTLPSPYQAPEREQGVLPGARADVFALGALLYRMLSGDVPMVQAPDVRAPALSNVTREPVPRELEELVARCLDPDPRARLSDLATLMRALRGIARELNMSTLVDERLLASSLPPAESLDADASGSIFGGEAGGRRGGAGWIVAGLVLALAAVWLLWEASTRTRRDGAGVREGQKVLEPSGQP